MLTFETLLVKELQKQQSRAEFCDIVLQTQGVSVPVHSCVLSAFSPWLCGALSAMPSPQNGQRRLIEVNAVEACTLLNLVSLLYSGQLSDNKEEVRSAASKLGINIPQREAEHPANDQNTQTESIKEVAERGCQTETLPSKCQVSKDTIETVNLSSWRGDQGLRLYPAGSEITLEPIENIQGHPEIVPPFQASESVVFPAVSGPACLPQVYVCPPAASFQQSPVPVASQSSFVEPLASQGESAGNLEGTECGLEAFAQFENNIPGFINYFLDSNASQGNEQMQRSQRGTRGDVKIEERGRRARGIGANGGFNVKGERSTVCRRGQNAKRVGRVARWIGIGQGGGRVGRMLDTRHMFKTQGRWRQQGRGAMKEEGEKGRSSARGRPRQRGTGSQRRSVDPESQTPAPAPRRRGRPRKQPLSRNSSEAPVQKTMNAPAPSMMHTTTLPAANHSGLSQPMDLLIDDIIAQLPLIPSNQNGSTTNATLDSSLDHSRSQSSLRIPDFGVVQPQAEDELNDILDSFLRTFEHHVGPCDSDFQDVPNVTSGSQSQNYISSTQPTSTAQAAKATSRRRDVRRPQKPVGYWQVTGVKREKNKSEETSLPVLTRSQIRKRKPTTSVEMTEQLPAKKRKKTKQEQKGTAKVEASVAKNMKEKTRKADGEPKHTTTDSNRNVTNALKEHLTSAKTPKTSQKSSDRSKSKNEPSLAKKKQACHTKRDATKPGLAGNAVSVSAFEIMKRILENQQKKEEESKHYGIWTVKKQKGKERWKNTCERGAEGKTTDGKRGEKRNDEETGRRMKEAGDYTLPSVIDRPTSKGERLMKNSDCESRFQTSDCSTKGIVVKNKTDVTFLSRSPQKTNKKLRNTRGSSESSDEDIDVVEVSSSLSAVPPVTDIIISTEEEEDSDEDVEIDVICL